MKKTACLLIIFILILGLCLTSCNKEEAPKYIDYSSECTFETKITETEDYLIFEPDTEERAKYGVLFFPGTAIAASSYTYFGAALSTMGYIVAIPKVSFAYMFYEDDTDDGTSGVKYTKNIAKEITDKYSYVSFYTGGHSQGGGAAVKYASENAENLLGCILMAPLTFGESIKDSGLATLIIEADNDHVLSDKMKEDSYLVIPQDTKYVMLENASHMSFSEMDDDSVLSMFNNDGDGMSENDKAVQKSNVIIEVCRFLNIQM